MIFYGQMLFREKISLSLDAMCMAAAKGPGERARLEPPPIIPPCCLQMQICRMRPITAAPRHMAVSRKTNVLIHDANLTTFAHAPRLTPHTPARQRPYGRGRILSPTLSLF
jgi:hypothetical protein